MALKTTKVKLGVGNYHDWGCRIICRCGHKEHFNKTHFSDDDVWRCDGCDRPLIVVHDGVPFYIGEAVFAKERKWGC